MQLHLLRFYQKDSKNLVDFYQNVFGWEIYPPQCSMEYRLMNPKADNGVMGAIGDPYAGEDWTCFYVAVDNIDETIEKVKSNGGLVKVPKFTTDTGFTQAIVAGANMRLSTLEKICKYLKCQPEDISSFK